VGLINAQQKFQFAGQTKNSKQGGGLCGVCVPAVPAARYCKRSFGFSRLLSLPLSMQDTVVMFFYPLVKNFAKNNVLVDYIVLVTLIYDFSFYLNINICTIKKLLR
jgi:hypothetical protein